MTASELLETQVSSTSASHARAERVEELPEDLLREATRRLGLLAAVWAGLFVIGIVMNDVVAPLLDVSMRDLIPWDRPADVVADAVRLALFSFGVSAAVTLALLGWSRLVGAA